MRSGRGAPDNSLSTEARSAEVDETRGCAMKRQSPMLRAIAGGVIAVAALASAPRARAQYAVFDADAALQVFHERVESYAALHRRLAPPPAALTGTAPLS